MADPYEGLQPGFSSTVQAFINASGGKVRPGSGYRSYEQQASLYNRWRAGTYNVPSVAPPGKSQHNHGMAMDLQYGPGGLEWAQANAAKFGLHFPVKGENWHVELVGGREGDHGHDPAEEPATAAPTGDTLESRLQSIMAIIGKAPNTNVETAFNAPTPAAQPAATMETGNEMPGEGEPEPPGKGVDRWRDLALKALQYTGQDPSNVDLMLRRMAQESSGNPRAINDWDINAKRGDPSRGLMQTISQTFNRHAGELAGRGIYDPFANMVASIRYTVQRYGNLQAGWSRKGGY